MARFVQESVGKCSPAGTEFIQNYPMHCAAAISRVFESTSRFSGAAVELVDAIESSTTTPAPAVTPAPQARPAPKEIVVQPSYGNHNGSPFQVPVNNVPQTPRLYAQQII